MKERLEQNKKKNNKQVKRHKATRVQRQIEIKMQLQRAISYMMMDQVLKVYNYERRAISFANSLSILLWVACDGNHIETRLLLNVHSSYINICI